MNAFPAVYKSSLIAIGGDKYAVRWPRNSNTVLSIQPTDGRWETRPDTAIGGWETGTLIGKKLVFEESGDFGWTVYVHEEL